VYSVDGEEAAHLEIAVGQLESLELEEEKEEENTREDALNGEGNLPDVVSDRSNDGLLEHAMSSGLLNDDDRDLFRDSIARIQRRPSRYPVEGYLAESGETFQLEIAAGQLDRSEEEESIPEAVLNGEGNASDEYLDESDEGLLEHAMHSGLLNEDDCEIFRESIARIQRRPS
jgi:hypothetical protein